MGAGMDWQHTPSPISSVRPSRLAFGSFVLDMGRCELSEGGSVIHMEPKPFELIQCLALNPGRLVTHEELLRQLWTGCIVCPGAVTQCAWVARRALHDDARRPRYIETVRKRGYRWVAEVFEAGPVAPYSRSA